MSGRWAMVWASLALASCGAPDPEPSTPEAAATSAPTRWVPLRRPDDASLMRAPAVVRAPLASGEVAAPVRVQVVRLRVQPGTSVAQGDAIVDVTSPELLEAAATYLAARRGARAQQERADLLDGLRAEGLASRSQIFERRAGARALAAERDAAAARLRAAGVAPRSARRLLRTGSIGLRAPVGGLVVALSARVGEIREPGAEPLARIRGEGAARIEVRTTEAWPRARELRFESFDGRRVALRTSPLASTVDPDDGTRVSWYAPVEAVALSDGLRGTVHLATPEEVWEVPVGAVAQRTGASELLRLRGSEPERIGVEVVGSSGAAALVRGPLREGDRVAAQVRALAGGAEP